MSATHEEHQNLVKVVIDLNRAVKAIAANVSLSGISQPNVRALLDDVEERLEKMYTYDNTIYNSRICVSINERRWDGAN